MYFFVIRIYSATLRNKLLNMCLHAFNKFRMPHVYLSKTKNKKVNFGRSGFLIQLYGMLCWFITFPIPITGFTKTYNLEVFV